MDIIARARRRGLTHPRSPPLSFNTFSSSSVCVCVLEIEKKTYARLFEWIVYNEQEGNIQEEVEEGG